jgi:hypothetical protein
MIPILPGDYDYFDDDYFIDDEVDWTYDPYYDIE